MGSQSIIITLDVDELLIDKIKQVVDAGFNVVEINSSEQNLLSKLLQDFPMLCIGAGNIINDQQLQNCHEADVNFVTSPGLLPALAQTATIYSINYLPSVATLSEAMQAMDLGCQNVRPFPANLAFCTQLNKCLPLLHLFPAEIDEEEAEHFLSLPSVAAVSVLNPGAKQLRALKNESVAIGV